MTLLPAGVKVHLAFGCTDMRKGIDGLAMLVQGMLRRDPFSGHLFLFRGRKANLIKIVFWDGTGLCLFTKRLGGIRWCRCRGWRRVWGCGKSCCSPRLFCRGAWSQQSRLRAARR